MFRRIKRLFYTSKGKLIIYLLTIVLFILSFLFLTFSLIRLSGIETIIRVVIILLSVIYGGFYILKCYKYMVNKNKVRYFLLTFITVIISIIYIIISCLIGTVFGELNNIVEKDKSLYTGYLITLEDEAKEDIKVAGIITKDTDVDGYNMANSIITSKKLNYELKEYDDYEEMLLDLYAKKIDASFVQNDYVNYFISLNDYFKNISNETKIVYKQSTLQKNKVSNISKNKTLKEPFSILLLGVDSTEDTMDAASSFNGDTLMLLTFNPHTLNATVFSIPRDLYVPITCRKNSYAKINSSSAGGVNCVLDTVENLTGISIDYYAKINFKGVVDLVEALKGIDVMVNKSFCEQDSNRNFSHMICLEEGMQHLNGEEALAYARHRHTLPAGDLQRIQNQQLIVEAMAKKLISLNTLTDFKDILSAISQNIVTNLSQEQILSSYNILKDIVFNVIRNKESLVALKAYLEVYDKKVYRPNSDTYSAALGYYESSLEDIVNMMKVNLEIITPTPIKEFSFDANTTYEKKIAGKNLKNEVSDEKMPSFIGLTVKDAEDFCADHNITLEKIYVNSTDSHYNNSILYGLIGDQSIKENTILDNINSLTIYINTI